MADPAEDSRKTSELLADTAFALETAGLIAHDFAQALAVLDMRSRKLATRLRQQAEAARVAEGSA